MKNNSELPPEEDNCRKKKLLLKAISEYALELTSVSITEDLFAIVADRLRELTGAKAVGFSLYDEESEVLVSRYTTLSEEENSLIVDKLGRSPEGMHFKLTPVLYSKITREVIGDAGSLAEISFGVIPEAAGKVIEKTLGTGWFTRISLLYKRTLLGMLIIAGKKNTRRPEPEELLAFAGITTNALRRWLTEKSLHEIKQNFQALTDNGKALIWTARPDKLCDYFNKTWLEFTGRTFGQEVGYGWAEGIHPNDLKHCLDIYNNAFDRREWFRREYRLRRHDGEFRWFQDDGAPRYDSTGKFIGYIGHCFDITERKRAEQALWESEEKYHTIFETTGTAILIVEKDTTISPANNQAAQIYGHDTEELIGRKWTQSVTPDCLEEMIKNHKLRQTEHGKASDKYEVKLVNKKGEIRDAIMEIGRIPETKQSIVSILDITERKQADEALAFERYLINTLIDNVPDYIYFKDSESRFIRISRALAGSFGLDHPSQAVDKTDFDFFTEEHARQAYEDEQEIIRTGRSLTREERETWPDRPDTWILTTKMPLRDKEGKIIGTFGISRDITERKLSEEALRESEEKYRLLIDTANESVIVAQDGILKFVNRMTIDMMEGYSEQELIGKPFSEFIHPDDRSMVIENYRRRIANEPIPQRYTFRVVTRDDVVKWVEINATLIEWQGKPASLNFLTDITERMRAEEALHLEKENFRHSLDDSPLGVRIATIEGNTIYTNRTLLNFYGYDSLEELQKTPLKDRYTPESYVEAQKRKRQRERGDLSATDYEISIVRKNGEIRHLQVFRKEVLWDGVRQFQVIYDDITKRVLAEMALRESEERYRLLFVNSGEAILLTSPDGSVYSANPEACRIFAMSEAEICKLGRTGVVDIDDPRLEPALNERKKTCKFKGELNLLRKDGTKFPAEITSTIFKDALGTERTSMIIRDISERKRTEQLLRQQSQNIDLINHLNQLLNKGATFSNFEKILSGEFSRLFSSGKSAIYLLDREKQHLLIQYLNISEKVIRQIESLIGISIPSINIPIEGVSLYYQAFREKKALLCNDPEAIRGMIADYARNVPLPEKLRPILKKVVPKIYRILRIRGIIIVPLLAGDEVIGLLEIPKNAPFSDENLRRIETITTQLTGAILRKKAEEMMQKSELKYSSLIEQAPDAIMVVDAEGNLLHVNLAGQKMLGYSEDELYKMKTIDTYPTDEMTADRRRMIEMLAMRAGETMHFERLMRRKDGTLFPVEISVGALEHGNSHAIIRDITQRKQTEATLRESEARFRDLYENSLMGISIASPDGRLIQVNLAYAQMFGYTNPEEMLTEVSNVRQLYANPKERLKILRILHEKGIIEPTEIEVLHRNGSRRFILVTIQEIKDADGKLLYNQTTHIDLTERRRIEDKVRASSLYARNLIEASLDPLITINAEGKITDVNLTAEQITGIMREKLIGSDFADYFTEPDKARKGYKIVFSKGVVQDYPLTMLHTSGRNTDVLLNATLFKNEAGEIQGVLATARNITDRKKMEEELRKSKELLENLNQHLHEIRENERALISREIHDELGQSMTALKLDLNRMHKYVSTNPEAVLQLDNMIELISNTIKNVQHISSELRPGILDDLGLVSAIEWYCDEFEKRTGIKCRQELDDSDYGDSKISLTFFRVLQETLTNVIRHARASSVNVKLHQSHKGTTMTIQDNGIGIPREKIESNKSLGLSSIRERVRQYNGKIDILSKKGNGTKLTIFIPS